ncbi:hypothetical protein [Serratia marcescens]|uniref:hypothetical protein n=1 Tax=Serratia marcescens TaxID=615 RepID=UPI0002B8574D|nr:hypothetical protein [Serratia marcescens]EMF04258.1 hypothetical protein F518_18498 [Serratia marcescens VGH107]
MNKSIRRAAMVLVLLFSCSVFAVTVKTDILVQAEVSTSVRVYVDGNDVTNGTISVELKDNAGYMTGTTPPFLFIGNASTVSLSLTEPAKQELTSEKRDTMKINSSWIREDGGLVSVSFPLFNQPVYPTLADVRDPKKGVKIQFRSAQRSETYPLGTYSGTYIVMVTPST